MSETKNVLSALAGRDEGRLARLERAGIIRRARRGRLPEILSALPPAPEPGSDVLRALLEERAHAGKSRGKITRRSTRWQRRRAGRTARRSR